MGPKEGRRFLYDAHGLAVGGRITRPFNEVVEAVSSISLPISGGHGSARAGAFAFRNLLSFRSAATTVTGSESDRHWNTSVTVEIEGLNVMGMVTAERIVARLTSERLKTADTGAEAPILPVGSYFEDLRIGGARVQARIRPVCSEHATFSAILHQAPELESPRSARPDKVAGLIGLPLFDCQLEGGGAGVRLEAPAAPGPLSADTTGMMLNVPGFGRVFVGELYMTPKSRRLNMLRLELGSPVEGEIVIAGIGGNGDPYP